MKRDLKCEAEKERYIIHVKIAMKKQIPCSVTERITFFFSSPLLPRPFKKHHGSMNNLIYQKEKFDEACWPIHFCLLVIILLVINQSFAKEIALFFYPMSCNISNFRRRG